MVMKKIKRKKKSLFGGTRSTAGGKGTSVADDRGTAFSDSFDVTQADEEMIAAIVKHHNSMRSHPDGQNVYLNPEFFPGADNSGSTFEATQDVVRRLGAAGAKMASRENVDERELVDQAVVEIAVGSFGPPDEVTDEDISEALNLALRTLRG